jgi:hypothetical protein
MNVRYYIGSNYSGYLYTCDFSINDGTQASHWVKTHGPVPTSDVVRCSQVAKSGNKIVIKYGSTSSYMYVSTNNGSSYSSFGVSASGWNLQTYYGFQYSRGRLIAWCSGVNSSVTGNTESYYLFLMSNDNGNSWTPSIRNSNSRGGYNQYGKTFIGTYDKHGVSNFLSEGGFIAAMGQYNYSGSQPQYYRMLIWCDDSDDITFADSTNLNNNSIRAGNKVRQGSNTANISKISGSSATLLNINGTISTGAPLINTVNYFGGNLSTMYGVINSAGTITDLSSVEPSFVNLGYLTDNTITFPAAMPSGNSPDVELASGTTITVSAEFANSQGTVGATSNTVTPT